MQGVNTFMGIQVDNAIIMAAGFSSRCMPLSRYLPKGLFKVRGEILIERQIRQIQEAGIPQIILVTGYKGELFEYLVEKYGVIIVNNPEYEIKNNISSLYWARDWMKNSYICCADNYFTHNVFHNEVAESYYACKYSEVPLQEYFIEYDAAGYICKVILGGAKGWYTMGEAFFDQDTSRRFVSYLESEYMEPEVGAMNWDDFYGRHIQDIRLLKREYADTDIYEFDELNEFIQFDPEFTGYMKKYC